MASQLNGNSILRDKELVKVIKETLEQEEVLQIMEREGRGEGQHDEENLAKQRERQHKRLELQYQVQTLKQLLTT